MSTTPHFLFTPFRLDPDNARLWHGAQVLALRPKAFAVLQYLVTHPNQLVTKHALLEAVWPATTVSDAVLKVCIDEIRKVLGDMAKAPRFIATVHSVLLCRGRPALLGLSEVADEKLPPDVVTWP